MAKKHRYRVPNRYCETISKQFHRHARMGIAQISHLWLMPGLLPTKITKTQLGCTSQLCAKFRQMHENVGQIKRPGSEIKSSQDCLGMGQVHSEVLSTVSV
eukprot:6208179-Pleurochrysis_carterae.AAC.1